VVDSPLRRRADAFGRWLLAVVLRALGATLAAFGGWIAMLDFTARYHDSDYFKMGVVVIAIGCLGMALGCGAVVSTRQCASRRLLAGGAVALAALASGLGALARALTG
jgi:hypothetical protein